MDEKERLREIENMISGRSNATNNSPVDDARPVEDQPFGIYNKITDDLMMLGTNMVVRMNVMLYSSSEKKGRKSFYSEVQYIDPRSGMITRKMHRGYDAYLSIETLRAVNGFKEYTILRGKEIEMIRSSGGLDIISDMTVNCSNFYEERNDKIYLTKNIGKEVRTNTEKKQTLTLIPTLTQKFNDELEPTVDIVLNNNVKVASTASWNQLYGLIYILRNVDIYTYAATMMNFIPRPDVGTNIYNMVPTYEEANKYGYKRPVKTFNPDSSYNGDYFAREQAKKEARKKNKKAKKEKEKEENKK